MKVLSLALLTLLLAAPWTGSQGISLRSSYAVCCHSFIRRPISAARIRSYQETPSRCSHKAMHLELTNGKKVCVKPEASWFQQYQQQQAPTSSST
ncbi:C-C motif chemokine 13-like [Colius striatus]|uniref:C-C motif chemokine 13-like n=1 Tax=Colius striatus TaxID=57412 RepID=UPI000529E22B|nr:C-C motif chemokine 13-like [Colius striatus]